jgi:hypothetical protein
LFSNRISDAMTLEFLPTDRLPGYAGALEAARHPDLANRFHFWRGGSGLRYASTRFSLPRRPAYENAVYLYVRRRAGEARVLGVSTDSKLALPVGTDEVHVHLVQGGDEDLQAAFEDLSALLVSRAPLFVIERQAA